VDELVAPELVEEAPADAVVVHRRSFQQPAVTGCSSGSAGSTRPSSA
jgi:hypothetical protein